MPNWFSSFNYDGFWWLPEKPDIKVSGKMFSIPGKGIFLKLIMSSEIYHSHFEHAISPETIHGYTMDGKRMTMFYCDRTGEHTSNSLNIDTIQYRCEMLIIGECYTKFSDVRLDSIMLNYTNLKDWLRTSFEIKTNKEYENDEIIHTAKYTGKKPIEIRIDSISATLYCGLGIEGHTTLETIDWEEQGFIEIHPDIPQTLEWTLEKSAALRNLLAFLMGLPVYRIELIGSVSGKAVPNEIEIYLPVYQVPQIEDFLIPDVMLFALGHLSNKVISVFQAWFKNQERIQILTELALGVLYGNHLFPKFEYLALVQGLEGYHRKVHGNDKINGDRYKLRERLEELYTNLPNLLTVQLGLNSNYLKSIVATRDYYSHYIDSFSGDVFNDEELKDATNRLAKFITILIFKQELNMGDQQIKDALQRTTGYGIWRRGH